MAEKYFLMPDKTIGKAGLPGGKLVCKKTDKPLQIEDKHVKILEKNLPFLLSQKIVVAGDDLEEAKPAELGKSEKRLALEAEATDLEVDFDDKTSQKDLIAAIDAKKEELNS